MKLRRRDWEEAQEFIFYQSRMQQRNSNSEREENNAKITSCAENN